MLENFGVRISRYPPKFFYIAYFTTLNPFNQSKSRTCISIDILHPILASMVKRDIERFKYLLDRIKKYCGIRIKKYSNPFRWNDIRGLRQIQWINHMSFDKIPLFLSTYFIIRYKFGSHKLYLLFLQ